ncbi:MAG: YabP/YqfC family sporulation protein [Clostridia bacterium]|nr:YabP/YqfC family sporulation protein [Clostridia bacterium]
MIQENEQNIVITQRQRAHLDGIEEVESFTESEIVALSSLGQIIIEGEELHIDSFSTETGGLDIYGRINGLYYMEERSSAKKGFLSRFTR